MPELALTLCGVWFLTLFVVRSIVQWRQTGATGFNGFRGRIGSTEWFAGFTATAGLVLTPIAPLSSIFHWPGGVLLFESAPLNLLGAVVAVVGIVGALVAQLTMGNAWRIGVDPHERTTLVTHGLYAWARNPIFSCMGASALGLALIVPNPLALAALLLTICGIQLQVRGVEEPYLLAVHGAAYQSYVSRVARVIPGVGKGAGCTQGIKTSVPFGRRPIN